MGTLLDARHVKNELNEIGFTLPIKLLNKVSLDRQYTRKEHGQENVRGLLR